MSLPNYLAKIKSSGIYRFVWDKSEIAGVDAEILRLVVGYSEKGPFNTPVYVKSTAEFKQIFGDVSKKLEKRGVYFHRMALQALGAGPILCLNLKKFSLEKVAAASFNVIDTLTTADIPVESIYDTTRFWKLEPAGIRAAYEEIKPAAKDKYIQFTAADSKETSCSIIMRAATAPSYDITLSQYYTTLGEELPDYLSEYKGMLVSDFFAEIYVFRGELTKDIATAAPLNQYLEVVNNEVRVKEYVTNAFGDKVDTLPLLAADAASNLVGVYTGCLLPYFKSTQGQYISLDLLFNADNAAHKMMMNLDADLLYNGTVKPSQIATTCWTVSSADAMSIKTLVPTRRDLEYREGSASWELVEGTTDNSTCFEVDLVTYKLDGITEYDKYNKYDVTATYDSTLETDPKFTFKIGSKVVTIDATAVGATYYPVTYAEETETDKYVKAEDYNTLVGGTASGKLDGYKKSTPVSETTEALDKAKWEASGIKVGDRFVVDTDIVTLTEIQKIESDPTKIKYLLNKLNGDAVIVSSGELKRCNHTAGQTNKNVHATYFKGYTYLNPAPESLSNESKCKWQNEIMSAMTDYQGIRLALTNRTDIDYRYLVDTFEAFIENDCHAKLAVICKEKDNALGLLNFPAIKTFKDDGRFVDAQKRFQISKIPTQGAFSLASEANGASFVSYNTPLVFTDGTLKTTVPSAALVSNNFMEKYLSRQPYYIVAGPTYGRMVTAGLVGPDFNFSRADLDVLEPFGVNCMVYVPRLGTYINSNQTAKQVPVTALSKINVRELVIYLQDEIEKLLQDYQWEFNTQELRDKVKEKANVICENIKKNGGIYEYLNVCDESNNTDDVINNEMLVLSTSIEPGMGAGKLVQELTIYAKGGMKSIIK